MGRLAAILMLVASSAALGAQVALADPRLPAEVLGHERLRDILLGRVTTWPDGTPIVLILAEEGDEAQRVFSGRDLARLLRGWKRLVYSGNGAMPKVERSVAEALIEAQRQPGALVFVPEAPEGSPLRRIDAHGPP